MKHSGLVLNHPVTVKLWCEAAEANRLNIMDVMQVFHLTHQMSCIKASLLKLTNCLNF